MVLPPAKRRGPAPAGVRLISDPDRYGEYLVADKDFEAGDLVLREAFVLLGPSELPPLSMFQPVPPEIGKVEIAGEESSFPVAVSFDPLYLKLLVAFANAEPEVQADALSLQDSMHPGSETFKSIWRVAEWLTEQELPWLEGFSCEEVARVLRIFNVNAHPCKSRGNTAGLLVWGSLVDHSCVPNVVYASVEAVGGECEGHYRACRPIRRGEVVSVSYVQAPVMLASLALRRRVLWWMKGFVCQCEICVFESQHGDCNRVLPCSCKDESCKAVWQFLPGLGTYGFGGKCGAIVTSQSEAKISADVLKAICSNRWMDVAEAKTALAELQVSVASLHSEHFASSALELLFLALEVNSKEIEHSKESWLRRLYDVIQQRIATQKTEHGAMRVMLAFKLLAGAVQKFASTASRPSWLDELVSWSDAVMAVEDSWNKPDASLSGEEDNSELEQLKQQGYVVVKGVLDAEDCETLRAHVLFCADEALRQQRSDLLGNIRKRSHRTDLKLDLCQPVVKALNKFIQRCGGLLTQICDGDASIVELAAITSSKGAVAQPVHADSAYGVPAGGASSRAAAKDVALVFSSLLALQDIEPEMGPTHIWPATNTHEHHATLACTVGDLTVSDADKVFRVKHHKMNLRRGDLVLYDSRSMHCGGENTSHQRSVFVVSTMGPGVRPAGPTWTLLSSLEEQLKISDFPIGQSWVTAKTASSASDAADALPPIDEADDVESAPEDRVGHIPEPSTWEAAVQCSSCAKLRPCSALAARELLSGFYCALIGFSCDQEQGYTAEEIDAAFC
eukprot:TRINITY_DN40605_c0_g1_i1.p1 TRINITY_DN40605_c0_g1~~TRINITY_DN40605_c0_g1_i1.p1  ORF type:complete len:802 (+),score=146.46 TRINITY_DN40605_c0_g1_i1:36-2408(+)